MDFVYVGAKIQSAGFTDLRLMRAPADGGSITEVPIGEALDESGSGPARVGPHMCLAHITWEPTSVLRNLSFEGKGP